MGFIQRLFGRAPAREVKAALSDSDPLAVFLTGSWGVPSKSGPNVSTGSALKVPAFWRGVRVISDGVRQLPVEIYKSLPNGRGAEPATDHPLYDVLRHRPNKTQSATDYWGTVLLHAAATGRHVSFKNVVRGQVRELIPIRPDWTTIDVQNDLSLLYRVQFENSRSETFTQDEVFHLRGPSWDGWDGLNPVQIGREALGLAMVTEETHARFHANGAQASGVLSSKDGKLIDPAEVERLRKMFEEKYAGAGNSGKPMILGSLDWKQTQMTGVDAEHLATRKHQIAEIARLLGLWPIMLGLGGDESPTFASAEAFMRAHLRFSLQPWLNSVKGAIETQLLTIDELKEGYHVRIDTSELVRGSLQERTEYYAKGLGTASSPGWLTQNEVREDDGWNPLDNPEADEVAPPPTNNPQGGAGEAGASAGQDGEFYGEFYDENGNPVEADQVVKLADGEWYEIKRKVRKKPAGGGGRAEFREELHRRDQGGRFAPKPESGAGRPIEERLIAQARSQYDDEKVYLVDLERVDAEWAKDPDFYIGPNAASSTKLDRAKEFLSSLPSGASWNAPRLGVGDDFLGFEDGRHRFAAMRALGVRKAPVAMDPTSAANAKRRGLLAE